MANPTPRFRRSEAARARNFPAGFTEVFARIRGSFAAVVPAAVHTGFWVGILTAAFSVQAQSGGAEGYAPLEEAAFACLENEDGPCTEAFEACTAYLLALTDDSLVAAALLELGTRRMRSGRWDVLSKELFDRSLLYSKRSGLPCVQMNSQFALARRARFLNESDSLLMHAERALSAAVTCGDSTKQARAEVYVGSACLNRSNYPEALKHFGAAETLYEQLGDRSGLGGLYLDMSLLYSEMHQKSLARSYTYRAAEIFKETGEDMKYGVALTDLSSSLLDVKMADSALYFLRIAEPIVTATNLRAAGYLEQNFGTAYYLKGRYAEAVEHYRKGLVLSEKIGNANLTALLHIWISESYLAMERYADAYRYAVIADSLTADTPKRFLRTKALYALAKAGHRHRDYPRSYSAFMDYINLTDSLFGEEKQREIAALEQTYEAEKSRKAIAFQKQENALLAAANAASTNRNYALLACLVLGLAMGYAFIRKQRYKLREQRAVLKIKQIENDQLNRDIDYKARTLTTQALHLARKNELIRSLYDQLKVIDSEKDRKALRTVVSRLKFSQKQEGHWDSFAEQFNSLNPDFRKNLREAFPDFTKSEMRLASLLRMGLDSKDIASMLNIGDAGMKKARYRLRKKMELDAGDSLETEIMKFG